MKKRFILICSLLILMLIFSGCNHYKDLETRKNNNTELYRNNAENFSVVKDFFYSSDNYYDRNKDRTELSFKLENIQSYDFSANIFTANISDEIMIDSENKNTDIKANNRVFQCLTNLKKSGIKRIEAHYNKTGLISMFFVIDEPVVNGRKAIYSINWYDENYINNTAIYIDDGWYYYDMIF